MAVALLFIHQQSPPIFHRDIKPANALLTAEGSRDVAKLADFGLHVVRAAVLLAAGCWVLVAGCWWLGAAGGSGAGGWCCGAGAVVLVLWCRAGKRCAVLLDVGGGSQQHIGGMLARS
jgi:hypothetical protein